MGTIRDRMKQDLALAGYAPGTQDHYLGAAARFVKGRYPRWTHHAALTIAV